MPTRAQREIELALAGDRRALALIAHHLAGPGKGISFPTPGATRRMTGAEGLPQEGCLSRKIYLPSIYRRA